MLGSRPGADQPVFGLEKYLSTGRNVVCDERRNPDSEINEISRSELERNALSNQRLCVHESPIHYEIVDKGRWRDDLIRGDDADWYDVFGRDNHCVGRHRHHRIEVASGEDITQVTELIGNKRMDKR